MKKLQKLMDDIGAWSDSEFGTAQRNPGIAHHLKKEVDELIEALTLFKASVADDTVKVTEKVGQWNKVVFEYADCLILLLDSAHHFSLSAKQLVYFARRKLKTNKARKWGVPDENGVVEHVREEAT